MNKLICDTFNTTRCRYQKKHLCLKLVTISCCYIRTYKLIKKWSLMRLSQSRYGRNRSVWIAPPFVHCCGNHTSSWEARFRVKGNDFAFTKHRFRLRRSSEFAPRRVPLFPGETKSGRRAPSTHCERSFKPFHRFHGGIPSRAKCATGMECEDG